VDSCLVVIALRDPGRYDGEIDEIHVCEIGEVTHDLILNVPVSSSASVVGLPESNRQLMIFGLARCLSCEADQFHLPLCC
jgi:hypothetical protein